MEQNDTAKDWEQDLLSAREYTRTDNITSQSQVYVDNIYFQVTL